MKTLILLLLCLTSLTHAFDPLALQQLELLQTQRTNAIKEIDRKYVAVLQGMLAKYKTSADAEAIARCESMIKAAGGTGAVGEWWAGTWDIKLSSGRKVMYSIKSNKDLVLLDSNGAKNRGKQFETRLKDSLKPGELISFLAAEYSNPSPQIEVFSKGPDNTIKVDVYPDKESYERGDAPQKTGVGVPLVK